MKMLEESVNMAVSQSIREQIGRQVEYETQKYGRPVSNQAWQWIHHRTQSLVRRRMQLSMMQKVKRLNEDT